MCSTLCAPPCRAQVYLCSASPPVRFPNVYGVDMPTRREFVATNLDVEQIREVRILARHRVILRGNARF